MEKLKTLNKQTIVKLLQEGNLIKHNTLYQKVYVTDSEKNILGAVRFDTYLKLDLEKLPTTPYNFNEYLKIKLV